jgi:hypothetical protein
MFNYSKNHSLSKSAGRKNSIYPWLFMQENRSKKSLNASMSTTVTNFAEYSIVSLEVKMKLGKYLRTTTSTSESAELRPTRKIKMEAFKKSLETNL